MMLMLP
jgi:hypothetical protein